MFKKLALIVLFPLLSYSIDIEFETALNIALSNNNELKIVEKELTIARLKLSGSFANLYYPSINAGGNFTYQFFTNGENTTTYIQGNKTIEITNQFPDNYTFSIGIDKEIFSGFKNYNNYQSAMLDYELKQKEFKDKQKEIWFNLFQSYFKLLVLQSKLDTIRFNLQIFSNQLRQSEEKYKLNIITLLELNQTNINLKNENINYLQYLNEYKKEEKNLLKIMNVKTNIVLTESISNISKYISTNIPSQEFARNLILSNDIQYVTYNYNLRKEEINKNTLEWSRFPSIYASFDYRWRYERDNSEINKRSWQRNWQVGLSFSLPIDSILPDSSTDISIKQSKENIEKIKLQMANYESELLNSLESYYSDIKYYEEALKIAEEKLKISLDNFNYAIKQKELKIINELEYSLYESSYLNAKDDYYSTIYNYYLAIAKIVRYL
ncbi:MAG: TolC family protein [Brevinematales bacterium]|nr:TolC family protein [Brevinematales bacterium]